MMVPFLVDSNTGTSMFESAEIVRYLETTYGAPS
jgi:glutathione S-transferase